jgi:hypothetical protein
MDDCAGELEVLYVIPDAEGPFHPQPIVAYSFVAPEIADPVMAPPALVRADGNSDLEFVS